MKTILGKRNITRKKSMKNNLRNLCRVPGCATRNSLWGKSSIFSAPHGRSADFSSGLKMGRLSRQPGAAAGKTHILANFFL